MYIFVGIHRLPIEILSCFCENLCKKIRIYFGMYKDKDLMLLFVSRYHLPIFFLSFFLTRILILIDSGLDLLTFLSLQILRQVSYFVCVLECLSKIGKIYYLHDFRFLLNFIATLQWRLIALCFLIVILYYWQRDTFFCTTRLGFSVFKLPASLCSSKRSVLIDEFTSHHILSAFKHRRIRQLSCSSDTIFFIPS